MEAIQLLTDYDRIRYEFHSLEKDEKMKVLDELIEVLKNEEYEDEDDFDFNGICAELEPTLLHQFVGKGVTDDRVNNILGNSNILFQTLKKVVKSSVYTNLLPQDEYLKKLFQMFGMEFIRRFEKGVEFRKDNKVYLINYVITENEIGVWGEKGEGLDEVKEFLLRYIKEQAERDKETRVMSLSDQIRFESY